ncbi:lipocalin family protein [Necropsobacter rosorum]|uniref:lipocalin family protein n=1 Tax=Necropsobacter rosorum TaxID=908285 RepID=UPI00050986DD
MNNLPIFINPIADLAPKTLDSKTAGADSWFLIANVQSGDKEFGLLFHYVTRGKGEERSTVSVIDITDDCFVTDIANTGNIKQRENGFEFSSANIVWQTSDNQMSIRASCVQKNISIQLSAQSNGRVFAYNSTGYIPLFGAQIPNFEYAFPQMLTHGTLTINGETYEFSGNAWFDRQWGALPVAGLLNGSARWLWFCATFDNGDCLALWSTRDEIAYDWLTILHSDGTYTVAPLHDIIDSGTGLWQSEKSGRKWHSKWRISLPEKDIDLSVQTTNLGQEIVPPVGDKVNGPCIEGAIEMRGTIAGKAVIGKGFVEIASARDFD